MANSLMRWDPFGDLDELRRQFFGSHPLLKKASLPTTDVYLKDDTLTIEAHLPNFELDNIKIEVDDGVLTISAERHETDDDKSKQYVVRESSDSFYRSIALPERADADKIKAKMDDGVLKVTVPLTPLPQPKKIAIEGSKKK